MQQLTTANAYMIKGMSEWRVLTWSIKSVAGPIVVVPLIESQPDVCGSFRGFLEDQAWHVAPQLEGGVHRQTHRAQRQVARPVHYLVGQVVLVPLLSWRTHTDGQGSRTFRSSAMLIISQQVLSAQKLKSAELKWDNIPMRKVHLEIFFSVQFFLLNYLLH